MCDDGDVNLIMTADLNFEYKYDESLLSNLVHFMCGIVVSTYLCMWIYLIINAHSLHG